jgi:hypothetical protein
MSSILLGTVLGNDQTLPTGPKFSDASARITLREIAKSRFHALEVWKRDMACYP